MSAGTGRRLSRGGEPRQPTLERSDVHVVRMRDSGLGALAVPVGRDRAPANVCCGYAHEKNMADAARHLNRYLLLLPVFQTLFILFRSLLRVR